jgi:hypothetical protein
MNAKDTEAWVRDYLLSIGLECHVEPPRGIQGIKTADLRARGKDGSSYVIEVKEKLDSDGIRSIFETQGHAEQALSIGPSSALSTVLKKANSQLESTSQESDLRIVWFVHSGMVPYQQHEILEFTLYGMQDLVDVYAGKPYRCYFFWPPAFAKFKDLDAVISCYRDHRERLDVNVLFVNPFAARGSVVTDSQLGLWFREHANVYDVCSLHQDPQILTHDDQFVDLPTSLKSVQTKYEKRYLSPMSGVGYGAAIEVKLRE